jgi:hypothetical protein
MANFIEITYSNIKADIERYLKREHNKGNILFSPASPYGQILHVLQNLHQLSFLYLKNAITQFDLGDNNALNERIVRNAAIFAGHIPGRAISSSGTLKFTLKTDIYLDKDIPGGRITMFNRTLIKNKTNSLNYILNLGNEKITHNITPNYTFFIPIIQGEWVTHNRTGDGTQLQTLNFSESGGKDVENFNVEVLVNGEYWVVKKHLWDMIPDEKACIVRTGFNDGIDVIFGNGGFGKIPGITDIITIGYLKTDGTNGNIFRRTRNDWKFVEDIFDGNGETLNPTDVFNIDIYTDINFGADKEDLMFTKTVMPIVSNNFVLGLPQQYAYEIKKLGVFSHVNAYEKTGTIFITATPNIKLFKSSDNDYFTVDLEAFKLDRYEISKIDKYLKTGGNLQLTKKYRIKSPDLSFYVMNIYVISYSDATDDSVNAQILDVISEYFLNLGRIDRIPKLDIIRLLSGIRDIHSVDIQFLSKKNEDYHRQSASDVKNKLNKFNSSFENDISIENVNPDYSYDEVKGLDPVLGDIIFEPSEIPIIRGGWYDRNGLYYSDNIDGNGLKSVNIIKKGSIDSKNRPII